VVAQPQVKHLLSSDHFSVDGTLLEAWASIKSFRRKDGGDADPDGPGRNAERRFHKEKRSNESHRSLTDPQARLVDAADHLGGRQGLRLAAFVAALRARSVSPHIAINGDDVPFIARL